MEDCKRCRQDVDAWIKDFNRRLQILDIDTLNNSECVNTNTEEIAFNYENMCRIEHKLDRLEAEMKNLKAVIRKMAAGRAFGSVRTGSVRRKCF